MNCPQCDQPKTSTLETRRADDGAAVRRRRHCTECGHRFTTFERAVPDEVVVVKRNGRRQSFDRAKLLDALIRASHKRNLDPRGLVAIVERIEKSARSGPGEIGAERIAELCLEGLAQLDRGAYQQFAGTLPDRLAGASENPRKLGTSGVAGSVRATEDAAVLTPKSNREEKS